MSNELARIVSVLRQCRMLYDGLGYFVALTASNILNLILYRASDVNIQSAGVSLSYSVTWIMSQRILIHLRDAGAPEEPHTAVTHYLRSLQDINTAIRAYALSPTRPQHELHRAQDLQAGEDLAELNLPVRIGRSIVADDRSHPVATPLDKALYTSQKAIWEQRQDV